jgi:hypothetical protein
MHWLRTTLFLAVLFGVLACDESTPDSSPVCRMTGEPLSLSDTFHQLRACAATRSYRAMGPYIEPASRDEVIELLIAVDELLMANEAALQAAKRACPEMDVRAFDLSAMADDLDLFSRNVTYVACEELGDRGVVTASVSGRLPLDSIDFIHRGDYWMYDPGPSSPGMASTIREIARALNRIAFVLSKQSVTIDDVRAEYRLRVSPKIRRLVAATATTAPAQE